jgi:hypothetical protein
MPTSYFSTLRGMIQQPLCIIRCLIQGEYAGHSKWHAQQGIERWNVMGNPEGNKPLQRPTQRCEDIKTYLMLTA